MALLAVALGSCTPRVQQPGTDIGEPRLYEDRYVTADGISLPLRSWLPEGEPQAVMLGLHGFNEHAGMFNRPAAALVEHGVALYAYDQRGFGAAPHRGRWPGSDRLVADAADAVALLRERYPDKPLSILGLSMGGAVAMVLLAEQPETPVDGAALVGPAVWGRSHMSLPMRTGLWLMAHSLPGLELTGKGLGIRPTDNGDVLWQMAHDPLMIRATRVDALWGLVGLMDQALVVAPRLNHPLLFLYGLEDQLVPRGPTLTALDRLPSNPHLSWRVAVYPDGYHMLLHDLQGPVVVADVAAWAMDRTTPLPSGADLEGLDRLRAAAD